MKVSWKWLQHYVDLHGLTPREVADRMTLTSLEDDGIVDHAERFRGIVLAQIIDIQPHDNADTLHVVTVDAGSAYGESLQVVCGGKNIHAGMVHRGRAQREIPTYAGGVVQQDEAVYAAFAPIGATVGDMTIQEVRLRGVASHGMLCGPDELGEPAVQERSIWLLSASEVESAQRGQAFAQAIGRTDVMIDFDVLANRPDCMGHKGVAREIAAVFERPFNEDWPTEFSQHRVALSVPAQDQYPLTVQCDTSSVGEPLSERYVAAVISGVDARPSPRWLQQALASVGQSSINAIVDVTNYLALDLAQPFHAFDYHALQGASMHIREALQDESVTALDGTTYTLPQGSIVIADETGAMDIAGIMGGKRTSVHDQTEAIVLQAAHFDARSVRETSRAIGLRTDAVGRYEKGVDAHALDEALEKALAILASLFPDLQVERVIDQTAPTLQVAKPIVLTWSRLQSYLGVDIPQTTVTSILQRLSCEIVQKDERGLMVQPPTWRSDLAIEEDLIEEVVRVYGYDRLPFRPMVDPSYPPTRLRDVDARTTIKRTLVSLGFHECVNYAFVGPELLEKVGIANEPHVRVINPLDEQQSRLRTELLSGLLNNAAQNLKHTQAFNLFEVGRVYVPTPSDEADERWAVAGLLVLPEKEIDSETLYRQTRSIVEQVLSAFHVETTLQRLAPHGSGCAYWAPYHPGRSATYTPVGATAPVATVSQLHPFVAQAYGIEGVRIGLFTMSLRVLLQHAGGARVYEPYSVYQAVTRDVSIVVEESRAIQEIEEHIRSCVAQHEQRLSETVLQSVELFDVFRSPEKLGVNKKSVSFRLTFQSATRTLSDEDIAPIVADLETQMYIA